MLGVTGALLPLRGEEGSGGAAQAVLTSGQMQLDPERAIPQQSGFPLGDRGDRGQEQRVTRARCSSVKCVLPLSRFTSRRSPTRGSGGCWVPVPRSWQCWAPSSCTRWASISAVSRARLWGGGVENKQPSQQGELKINNLLSKGRACSPCAHHPSCAEGLDRVIHATSPGV